MAGFAEVHHEQWIAAPVEVVRAQFADLDHHIRNGVHPRLRFQILEQQPRRSRFVQEVKLLGIRQRDVFERTVTEDGGIEDRSVEGFNAGGSLRFGFRAQSVDARPGTLVTIEVRLPLPPLVGGLVRPLLQAQIRKEVRNAALEDRFDIEHRGYPRVPESRGPVA